MDFRDSRAGFLIGRPQLLAALDEQGLADSLRLAFGPAFARPSARPLASPLRRMP